MQLFKDEIKKEKIIMPRMIRQQMKNK